MNMKGDDNFVPMSLFTVSEVIFSLSSHCLPSMSLHNQEDFWSAGYFSYFSLFYAFLFEKLFFFSFPVVQKFSKKVPFGNTILGCFPHHETKAEEVRFVEDAGLSPLPTATRCWGVRPAVNITQQPCCPCSKLWASRGWNLHYYINAGYWDGQMRVQPCTVTLSGAIFSLSLFFLVSQRTSD